MMSASTETISCVQPNTALVRTMTKLTGPAQNGDLAVTMGREGSQLQGFCGVDRRTVTPEVAGSSPVAPALELPVDAGNSAGSHGDSRFRRRPGQRSRATFAFRRRGRSASYWSGRASGSLA
jgi:hypothetical protein